MTSTFSKFIALGALAAGVALLPTAAARAGEWFQPPGSTEVGSATFPDGSTNYEFRMPDGTLRLVSVDKNGGMRRYFNPRGKRILVNKKPPVGGNPYIPTNGQPLCDRATGCGISISVGGG